MRSPHLDPAWLRQKYIAEGLSTYDIAALVARDPKRIHEKLRDFGIPTRPRGHNLHGADNAWAQEGYVPHWLGRHHTDDSRARIAAKARGPKPHLRGEANGMHGVTGEANPNYRGGISPERQRIYASSAWKSVRREVLARDGRTCRRCETTNATPRGLHLHHIQSWNDRPDLRLAAVNLVTFCRTCHEWIHSLENTAGEWLGHEIPNRASSANT